MKIAFCHNNFNHFGGGEAVALTMMDELVKKGHEIIVYTHEMPRITDLEKYFGINIDNNIKFINIFRFKICIRAYYADYFLAKKVSNLEGYDLIIDTSSNGFFPIKNRNAKSICYVHFPMLKKPSHFFWRIYLMPIYSQIGYSYNNYDHIIANSNFTKEVLEKSSAKNNIKVINPPTDTLSSNENADVLIKSKKNIILVVGRFVPEKKILLAIEQFKLIHRLHDDYMLCIIGTSSESNNNYYEEIKRRSNGFPIFIYNKEPRTTLEDLYRSTKIYWHLRGHGESDNRMFENFGITTVEAMNRGCIPIVINKGGPKEIVDHGKNGFLWNTKDELVKYTSLVIKEYDKFETMARAAIKKSELYSESVFKHKTNKLIKMIEKGI